jgi:hypothetical protein
MMAPCPPTTRSTPRAGERASPSSSSAAASAAFSPRASTTAPSSCRRRCIPKAPPFATESWCTLRRGSRAATSSTSRCAPIPAPMRSSPPQARENGILRRVFGRQRVSMSRRRPCVVEWLHRNVVRRQRGHSLGGASRDRCAPHRVGHRASNRTGRGRVWQKSPAWTRLVRDAGRHGSRTHRPGASLASSPAGLTSSPVLGTMIAMRLRSRMHGFPPAAVASQQRYAAPPAGLLVACSRRSTEAARCTSSNVRRLRVPVAGRGDRAHIWRIS